MAQLSCNKCFLCTKGNGDLYCRDCERFLCKTCKPVHDLIPSTQHHTVIDANQEGRLVFKPKPVCGDHKKEYVYYCNKCDCLICSNCIISAHSGHPCCDYMTIVDQRRQNVIELIGTITAKVQVLEDSLNTIKNNALPQINSAIDDFDKKVNAVTKEIGSAIDRVKNIYKTTASDYKSIETEKLSKIRTNVERVQNEYKNILLKFEHVLLEQHGVTFLLEQNAIQMELKNLDEIPEIPTADRIPNFSADSFTDEIIDELQTKFNIRALKEKEKEIRKLKETVEKAEQYKLISQSEIKQLIEKSKQLENTNEKLKLKIVRIVKKNTDEKEALKSELDRERYQREQIEKQTELDAEKETFKESQNTAKEALTGTALRRTFGKPRMAVKGGNLENCVICMDSPTAPRKLNCGHIFCKECISLVFKVKPVCPTCGSIQGVVTGDQPPGLMKVRTSRLSLPGNNYCGRIEIEYVIHPGIQGPEHPNEGAKFEGITRVAYLPDNEQGRQIAKLLRVAFDRRLIFTIGRSRTTDKDGVVTWNDIHHKTSPNPGNQFGYPDDTYLERVLDELKAKGVTEKDL